MRYLLDFHIETNLNRGKSIEQFLGDFITNNKRALRFISIRKLDKNEYLLYLHEVYDQGSKDYLDPYEFEYINLPKDRWEPIPKRFEDLEKAILYACDKYGAKRDKFVSQGIIEKEYLDYLSKRSQSNPL